MTQHIDPTHAVRVLRAEGKEDAARDLERAFELVPPPKETPPSAPGAALAPPASAEDAAAAQGEQWLANLLGGGQ
jgi:hypothetical protein